MTLSQKEIDSKVRDLDLLSLEIIEALADTDAAQSTTDLKRSTGESTNAKLTYRVEKLDGLVETEQPKSESGRPKPKIWKLTDTGREFASGVDWDSIQGQDKSEELRAVRRELSTAASDIGDLREQQIDRDELDDTLAQFADRIIELERENAALKKFLNGEFQETTGDLDFEIPDALRDDSSE